MSQVSLSQQLKEGNLFAEQCPSREVLKHVTSRWGVLILVALREGTHRFSDLRRKIGGVSEKVAALADWIELNLPEVLAVRDERAA
ncbi:helix-turn-helix transcriptional regulator [Escherichia coli]|uniref:winged helix-turn-helix transcriptional regulator n=1 Tax=Escherichia coli TaxID=562 RepID=UPI000452CD89|nr:winged helix-turn-helix transcriptional regulator [Escherichia coli]EED0380512.1 helix-turn-helix transcriptional regulator [Escherichia coli]EED1076234.1 helix-turn-helix transcriptional regulator [Escherichia coli]EEG9486126.1 helix-turn-helix transcriptional regulator [Escherichia coli]EEQ6065367.1 helix-turn-helix transcriptional regulator [Escherichia coli]EER4610245.1 helix-turn-helix transcriptional regulator [Escherichia coli]